MFQCDYIRYSAFVNSLNRIGTGEAPVEFPGRRPAQFKNLLRKPEIYNPLIGF
ncbi:hypothetical protein CLOSTASPAR_03965 [[Clostridium] asparagiforme DSM 15981]|uniref:Uncharacterized protein n=1 Tax=[Clostridium] asparagiforme DSM 15981 TaxID=518636 RepID=C0D3X4_9FIRM|nr:hypothetical protein CLOSTASPAR_03965 [[Clostridium] asparagiforme DSM 15981]